MPTDLVSSCQVFPPFFVVRGYEDRYHQFLSRFTDAVITVWRPGQAVDPHTDVLLFPYDFRRSVVAAAEQLDVAVGEWLRQVPQECRPRRVVLLAHSMGGLVARYWLGPLGGHPWCKALITLGTPHRGAPKAADWLVNGAPVPWATEVLRGWPSVYELLPQYEAVWDEAAGKPCELVQLPGAGGSHDGYAPRFAALAAQGRRVHECIFDAWQAMDPDRTPDVVPFAGRGHATPSLLRLHDGKLRVVKEDPPWRGNVGWRGDGTVPMLCAIPREMGDDRHKPLWRVVADRHLPLGCAPDPLTLLELYAGQPVPSRGGETPERPWLALDLDNVVDAGARWRVDAWVEPGRDPAGSVSILVDPVDGGPAYDHPFRPEGSGWSVTVPPQAPGVYEVTVQARGVPGVGMLTVTDLVAVVDPDRVAEDGLPAEDGGG
ncbi:MAG TPA: hypothetical protein VFM54_17095 [Micromonosporaceae bacterium]|nr:hypothetical protein [Micromonosporaceae bacterium]